MSMTVPHLFLNFFRLGHDVLAFSDISTPLYCARYEFLESAGLAIVRPKIWLITVK